VRQEGGGGGKGPRTNTAIIRTLGTRETPLGPTEWLVIRIKKGVLLLETEPGFMFLDGIHHLLGVVTEVSLVGGTVVVVGLGEDEDVVATTKGISEDGSWAKVDIGIVARCLVRGRPIEVPDAEAANVLDLLGDSLSGRQADPKRRHMKRHKIGKTGVSPRFRNEPVCGAERSNGWQTYRRLAAETIIAVDPNVYQRGISWLYIEGEDRGWRVGTTGTYTQPGPCRLGQARGSA